MQQMEIILEKLNHIETLLSQQTGKPLNFEEAAKYLGYSHSHLYKLTSTLEIPHYRQGKRLYFKASELDEWLMGSPVRTAEELEQAAIDRVTLSRQKKSS